VRLIESGGRRDVRSASQRALARDEATVRSPLGSEDSASLRASLPRSPSLGSKDFASLRASLARGPIVSR
jgi:hypothetical protein